jgi:hypothetical protein
MSDNIVLIKELVRLDKLTVPEIVAFLDSLNIEVESDNYRSLKTTISLLPDEWDGRYEPK